MTHTPGRPPLPTAEQPVGATPPDDASARPCIAAEVCAAMGGPSLVLGTYILRSDVQPLFTCWGVAFLLIGVVFSLLALGQVLNLCE